MIRQPAKVLAPAELRRVLKHVQTTRYPSRSRVMVLLSFKAGLRACEIAGLTWAMVLTGSGRLSPVLTISGQIAKFGRGRSVPVHPMLAEALGQLHKEQGSPRGGPVIRSERGRHMTPRSVVNWFKSVYGEVGLDGCSSHSGRRTFITGSARLLAKAGGSLRDVQELAGHQALTTTERYIQGDRAIQRKLVALL